MNTAVRLKILRSHYQLSMRALADMVGVSQAQVSMWESGKNVMPRPAAMAFQAALGVRWEWLLNGDGEMLLDDMGNLSPEEVRLIEIYRHLDMAGRNDLLVNAAIVQGMMERRLDRNAGKK